MEKEIIGGVFRDENDAIRAVKELNTLGYGEDDLTVIAKDKDEVKDIKNETGVDVEKDSSGRGKNAGKGLGIGAGTGGVLGGLAALIAEGALIAIPGVGPLIAAGPLAATITGLVGGGLVGALTGAGIPEEHAKEYERYLKDGYIIILVEVTENRNDVYTTFVNNRTANTSMYPNDVVVDRTDNRAIDETRPVGGVNDDPALERDSTLDRDPALDRDRSINDDPTIDRNRRGNL